MRSLFGQDFDVRPLGHVDALDEALRARGATRSLAMRGIISNLSISAEVSWSSSIFCRKRVEKTSSKRVKNGFKRASHVAVAMRRAAAVPGWHRLGWPETQFRASGPPGAPANTSQYVNVSGWCSKEMSNCFQSCRGKPFKLSFSIQSASLESGSEYAASKPYITVRTLGHTPFACTFWAQRHVFCGSLTCALCVLSQWDLAGPLLVGERPSERAGARCGAV